MSIEDLQIISGNLPRTAERLVLEWAQIHQGELMKDWLLCEIRQMPTGIEPVTWLGELDLAPDVMYTEIKKNGKWVLL